MLNVRYALWWPIRLIIVLGLAYLLALPLYSYALPLGLQTGWAVMQKLTGRATICTWPRVLRFYPDVSRLLRIYEEINSKIYVVKREEEAGLELLATPHGPFWVPSARDPKTRHETPARMAALFAEQEWVSWTNPEDMVRRGDIVLDVGAHAGTFTAKALRLGAQKVVAIEPDPDTVECLRRNFSSEISAGRVVVVGEGAWSSAGKMTLYRADFSGLNSLVLRDGRDSVEVTVRTIDDIVRELRLPRLDYISMDIKGAENEALKGAVETLRAYHPRLAIDSYNRSDDMEVLPPIIRRAGAKYAVSCGPCRPGPEAGKRLIPYVTFYR